MCWMLPARAIGYVVEVDENFNFKLRNPDGKVSAKFLSRRLFRYAQKDTALKDRQHGILRRVY